MSDATGDPTRDQQPSTMTIREVHGLADRLHARGATKLSNDTEHQQRDLRLAARVIRALVRSFAPSDVVTVNGA